MADYLSQFTGSEIDTRLSKVSQLETGKQDKLVSGTNIKTINGSSVLGGGDLTIQTGDPNAVLFTSQTLTDAQKEQARANIDAASLEDVTALNDAEYIVAWDGTSTPVVANIPAGVTVTYNTTTYTGTLAASASTAGNIYLVKNSSNYDMYVSTASGSSYSWVGIGSTALDLSGYATTAQLNQLDLEVHNLSGKYYGIFEDAESLPEGYAAGYAFVGTTAPFAIYQFDGTDWADSGATVDGITGEPGVGFESVASPDPADGTAIITLSNGDTVTIDLNHNHPAYYSKVLGGAQPVGGFEPDVVYSLGTLSGAITFSLASPVTGNVNHYFWMFVTGVSAPTITWPAGITWAAGSAPTVAANKKYEISILNGVAYYSEV